MNACIPEECKNTNIMSTGIFWVFCFFARKVTFSFHSES